MLAAVGNHVKVHLMGMLGEVVNKVSDRLGRAGYDALTEPELLVEAESLVVKKRNKLVNCLKLAALSQGEEEAVTTFEKGGKPVERTGKFKATCGNCQREVHFTDKWF